MVDSVPFSMNSCDHSSVFSPPLLVFSHLVEMEKPVRGLQSPLALGVCVQKK